MKREVVSVLFVFAFLMASVFVIAKPDFVLASNENSGVAVVIPSHAVEVADGVFSLGTAVIDGKKVEGMMFIHYKRENAKPPWAGGGKGDKGGSTCYAFLAKGAKWKNLESWVVNPANTEGLSDGFVFSNLASDIQKWGDASSFNILGDGSTTTATLVADTSSPDNQNEVYFGSIDSPGAIAVTIVWGIFSGPPRGRELVEWDMVYDQVDFDWSASGEAGKMDFENIATHELGHAVGMGHPGSTCLEETMYAYAGYGETKKRDLNAGDIVGISKLY